MTTLETLQSVLKANYDLEPEAVRPNAQLEDLELDSLAVVEILFAVEERFKVIVPQEPAVQQTSLRTVGDLVAYIDRLVAEQHPVGEPGAPV
ncbi:MAG TPA: acyl carrier protein [Casimicrobiaceae bacterium]|nr:acyl carrier protein [Casimicrobiaceae bacterium]